jgi:uncharacterized membrane protein YhaH (DUF805 family)
MTDANTIIIPGHRVVSFTDSISLFFKNYFNFEGRSSRGAYWYWVLASMAIAIILTILDYILFGEATLDGVAPLGTIFNLIALVPGVALTVRRLHDIGRSGWWVLLILTIVGLIPLIYWYCQPGNRHPNKFGNDHEAGR